MKAIRSLRMPASVVLAALMASTLGGFQVAPGQVAYYKFEETAGNTAFDSSGNGFNGTWKPNSGAMAMSVVGDCAPNVIGNTRSLILTKPGAPSQYGALVSVPNNPAFTFTGPFTVMAWIKPSAFNAGDNPQNTGAIVHKWNYVAGSVNGYAMNRELNGKISFYMGNGVGSSVLSSNATTPVGSWSHATIVFTGTHRKIYINGILDSSDAFTTLGASSAPLHIGVDDWVRNYYGSVDEVRLFNTSLTASEVKTYYDGVAPPGGLTATAGVNSVKLAWNAVTGATSYNILRSMSSGGPYTLVGSVSAPATTSTDTTVANPYTYYYVVQTAAGSILSSYSTEVSCTPLPPEVTALPMTGLQTNENGASTTFDVKFNQPAPAGGSLVTVSSNNLSEGIVSTTVAGAVTTANGFQIVVPAGTSPTIPVLVIGVDDFIVDGNVPYTISVSATGFPGLAIPDVQCTNNDNDIPGVTFSKTSGLVTSEGGGTDSFTVLLNTQPYGPIAMSLMSSNTAEGTVSPSTIVFTPANWNVPQVVTLTGVDDSVLDFNVAYTILTGALVVTQPADAPYAGLKPPDVSAVNLDDEVIPPAHGAWGRCGLLGAEFLPALLVAALVRRLLAPRAPRR